VKNDPFTNLETLSSRWDIVIYMSNPNSVFSLPQHRRHKHFNLLRSISANLHHKFTSINIALIIVWFSFFLSILILLRFSLNSGRKKYLFINPNNLIPITASFSFAKTASGKSLGTILFSPLLILTNYVLIDFATIADFFFFQSIRQVWKECWREKEKGRQKCSLKISDRTLRTWSRPTPKICFLYGLSWPVL
jgi:hypothetical protein